MTNSFVRLYGVEPGFRIDNLAAMHISLPRPGEKMDTARWAAYWPEIQTRAKGLNGVKDAALVMPLPIGDSLFSTNVGLAGAADAPVSITCSTISNNYFDVLDIPLRDGRAFGDTDASTNASRVIVINESVARQHFPERNPLGEQVIIDKGYKRERSVVIVGIVADSKSKRNQPVKPHFYMPVSQSPAPSMYVVTRTTGDPAALKNPLRSLIFEMDRDQPVGYTTTMEEVWAQYTIGPRFYLTLFGSFAIIALLLAVSGIYSIFSHSVNQRTREIGIRMALGARPENVLRMVLAHGLRLAAIGIILGLGGAFALTRLLKDLLYEVGTTDPVTFTAISLLMIGVALAACLIPARRATKVDPLVALRYE